jgi:RimJ/RimL family protein N-acetyltransferase
VVSKKQRAQSRGGILNLKIKSIEFDEVSLRIKQHLNALPSAIDSFLEDHILESAHYQLFISNQEAGFASVHKGSLLTQFSLLPEFRKYGQAVFGQVKKLEEVQAAFVPTCDEFFLSHALDDYRQLNKQAYFFAASPELPDYPSSYALRQAEESDIELIREGSGDFFGDIKMYVDKQKLFLTLLEKKCVAFGLMEKSVLLNGVASIGMFVAEDFRRKGAGTATIRLLIDECKKQNLRPIAGCWYYNHLSKKTLERAGMFTQTRLLKIEF